ncbi:FMN adenylyltransferase (EC / Riboflavin kinase (EC [Olavius algarvensis associated proteobacterium Delta 3]|nr:FMN adenylyltransferase (EC / Riboflavin kinase (EC [Olavius algarvensis associated proteobacterium Delta 3]CAB5154391.1 FMN adenylyltransferase (EC / Riboflavin kinase (EC [Olavius algarvensis associated proteobacterium Delta 3]
MKLIENLNDIREPFRNAVITIGNFDGVHIGHQALFHEVIERAEAIGGTAIAMTFEPHPIRVLKQNGHPPLITLYEQKIELMESAGLDVVIGVPFTLDFAALTAREFIEDLLIRRIGARVVVVGRDYTFGKNREGTVDLLESMGRDLDFDVVVADWIPAPRANTERISSTRIRELVMDGSMTEAQKMLGRHYQIRGEVERGRDRGGKLLGFPTANINLQDELCPKTGVYAATVEFDGTRFKGVANIGYSPTFEDHQFTVEVHILDFDNDIYGKKIRVNFIKRLREEIKFSSVEELSRQIHKDVDHAREILSV